MAEPALVDLDVIAELRDATGGDMDFVRELVETFVAEAAGHLAELDAAAAAGDAASAVRPAHTMKSSSASVGAMRLSALCRGIEETTRAGSAEGLGEHVLAVRGTWDDTLEAFRTEGLAA